MLKPIRLVVYVEKYFFYLLNYISYRLDLKNKFLHDFFNNSLLCPPPPPFNAYLGLPRYKGTIN